MWKYGILYLVINIYVSIRILKKSCRYLRDLLEKMNALIKREIELQKSFYEKSSNSAISFTLEDNYKVLEVLKRLANQN